MPHFDNLVFPHTTQQPLPADEALKELKKQSGRELDEDLIPKVIEFLESNSGKSENYLRKRQMAVMQVALEDIIQKFKAGKISPPVMPKVVREIQNVLKDPNSSAEKIAAVIEKDPTISLRLVSVANSPVYRGIEKIKSVQAAIPRLGIKETLNIVVAIANRNLYETNKVQYKLLMDKLWVHSLACAYGSRLLAQELGLEDPDSLFSLGLVHDIGKALLLQAFTQISPSKKIDMDVVAASINEAHLRIGGALLKLWAIADEYLEIVSMHEGPEFNPQTGKELLVVNLANMLSRDMGFSLFDEKVDFAQLESAKLLNIEPDAVIGIGEEIKKIIQDVAHLF